MIAVRDGHCWKFAVVGAYTGCKWWFPLEAGASCLLRSLIGADGGHRGWLLFEGGRRLDPIHISSLRGHEWASCRTRRPPML